MIKESEIRVGNVVSYYKPGYDYPVFDTIVGLWKVPEYDVVYYLNNHSPININGLMPIPLTPEVLESAGFKKWVNSSTYSREFINGDTIQIDGNEVFLGGSEACISAHGFTSNIYYLHQLQNLYFAITGTELEIKAMAPSASHTS